MGVKIDKLISRFTSSVSGNFASAFAITAVPMLTSIGMMIDYTNLSREQEKLQQSVDAAALMAGAYYRDNGDLPSTNDVLQILHANDARDAKIETLRLVGNEVELIASVETNPKFLSAISSKSFDQFADATVPVGVTNKVEIALVLDSTRSMKEEGRMIALREVASDFTEAIFANSLIAEMDAVSMALVPFAKYINVGLENRNEPWIDVPPDQTWTRCNMRQDLIEKNGCEMVTTDYPTTWVEEKCSGPIIMDGVEVSPYQCQPGYWKPAYSQTKEVCDEYVYGPEYEVCETKTQAWRGCVGSRVSPLNLSDNAYEVPIPGIMDVECTRPLFPLSTSKKKILQQIKNLKARGTTYMAPGIAWGRRILSGHAPFEEGDSVDPRTRKFMIVMGDGDNSIAQNTTGDLSLHDNEDPAFANAQTLVACEQSRDDGIIIFSIAFGTSITEDGKATLKGCASDAGKYYNANDAEQLEEAFEDILSNIFAIKLSS